MKIAWGLLLAGLLTACGNREPLSQREVAMRILAEHLQKNQNPRSVLLLGNPFSQSSGRPPEVYRFQKASEDGLRGGLARSTQLAIAYPALKPEAIKNPQSVYVDPKSSTPLSFLVAENAFEEAFKAHPRTDLVVSVIGLPVNTRTMSWWTNANPRFALLLPDLRMIGDAGAVRQAFVAGKIVAAIVPKPGAAPRVDDAFDKAFVLVTDKNVDAFLPLLFQ